MARWKANQWRTRERKPVKNEDLWRKLDEVASGHAVNWQWLKGHAESTGKLGSVGFCFGGGVVNQFAVSLGDALSAGVPFYGAQPMAADVAKITAPVMLVYADADAVTPAHMMEFWALVGGGKRDAGFDGSGRPLGRLAIVPGTTHYNILATDMAARLVTPFLDQP